MRAFKKHVGGLDSVSGVNEIKTELTVKNLKNAFFFEEVPITEQKS